MNFSKTNANFNKKVVLPFIKIKEIRPICSLLSPPNLLVPMILSVILGQITDNLKGVLNPKDIQQIPSVKLYTKAINVSYNSVALSVVNSIAKTLGPELETLSVLDVKQRLSYLKDLQDKIISDKGPGRVSAKSSIFYDSFELAKHRRGLTMQYRSLLVASSIFAPNNLVVGLPISQVDIKVILYSCKLFWSLLGLEEDEFDFLIRKYALSCYRDIGENDFLSEPTNSYNAVKVILFNELKNFLVCEKGLILQDDFLILNGYSNLTLIEKELQFISRPIPELPKDLFISDYELKDNILRASIEQRKTYNLKMQNVFKRVGKKLPINHNGVDFFGIVKSKKLFIN